MKRFLSVWVVIVSAFFAAVTCRAYDIPEAYTERFGTRTLSAPEGLWVWNSGAIVAIESAGNGAYVLTLVQSDDPFEDTPRPIGHAHFGGQENTYVLELNTVVNAGKKKSSPKTAKFTARLTGNRLTLEPINSGLNVNMWRLVPYLFRFSVTRNPAPRGVDGAVRVWPVTGSPDFPVTL